MSTAFIFWFLFLTSVSVQLYYHCFYFYALIRHHDEEKNEAENIGVTVVVAAKDEAALLPQLVSQIINQDYPSFELVVVNDRSTDNSDAILNDLAAKHKALKVIHIHELPKGWNGKKYALQLGIEAAKNEIILLTDADCLPNSNQWISKMAGNFSDATGFVLGFSPYASHKGFLNQFIRFETLFTAIQYLSFAIKGEPYMGVGRNMAYRKSIFLQNSFDGFKDQMGGDDDLFVNAHATDQNTRICTDVNSQTTSLPKTTWREFFIQKIRHLSVGKKYRKKDQTRLGALALSSLVSWGLVIVAITTGFNLGIILVIFGVRSLSFYIIFTLSGRKLKVNMQYVALPLLDLCFNLYYPTVGLVALISKKVKWS